MICIIQKWNIFDKNREILSKILAFTISVPISTAAIAIANEQSKMKGILIISYIFFSIVSYIVLDLYNNDINGLETQIISDKETIHKHSGFKSDFIENEFSSVLDKIHKTKQLIYYIGISILIIVVYIFTTLLK